MNMHREENAAYCYFHPKEIYVGVCPLCLNERLLVLASKQSKHSSTTSSSSSSARGSNNLRPNLTLPKIFAFGSFLNRLDLRHRKFDLSGDLDTATSQEDSFISIKFEDNGNASWEKNTMSKVSLENCNMSRKKDQPLEDKSKSVIEHHKARSSLRWRRRIGHLFQLIRLRGSTSCHVASKVEGVKVRKQGWVVRTLTRRKTKT